MWEVKGEEQESLAKYNPLKTKDKASSKHWTYQKPNQKE